MCVPEIRISYPRKRLCVICITGAIINTRYEFESLGSPERVAPTRIPGYICGTLPCYGRALNPSRTSHPRPGSSIADLRLGIVEAGDVAGGVEQPRIARTCPREVVGTARCTVGMVAPQKVWRRVFPVNSDLRGQYRMQNSMVRFLC